MQANQRSSSVRVSLFAICIALMLILPNFASANVDVQSREHVSVFLGELESIASEVRSKLNEIDVSGINAWHEGSLKEVAEEEKVVSDDLVDAAAMHWDQVLENERLANERLSGALLRQSELQSFSENIPLWRSRLNDLVMFRSQFIEDDASLSQIEASIGDLRTRQQQIMLELDQKQSSLQRLEEQERTQTELLNRLMNELNQESVETSYDPENIRLMKALDALMVSTQRRQEARLLAARLDQALLQPRIQVLRIEVKGAELELSLIASTLQWLENELNLRSTQELRELSASLSRLIERDPEIVQQFSNEIAEIRQRINSVADQYDRIRNLQGQRTDYENWIGELRHSLRAVEERLEIGGLTQAVGTQFLDEQKRLDIYGNPRATLQALERDLVQSRLRSVGLRDDLRRVRQLPEVSALVGDLQELMRIGTGLLDLQIQAEQQLTEELRLNEYRLREVSELSTRLDLILKETLLWWPSHSPISAAWFNRVPDAVPVLLEVSVWQGVVKGIVSSLRESPLISLMVILLVAGLYVFGRKTDTQLQEIAKQTTHKYTDNIGLTFKAMGWSLLAVLPIPVFLYGFSYVFLKGDINPGVEILSSVMFATASWWLAGHLFLIFTKENGVGRAHFEWNPLLLRRIRLNLIWFLPSQLSLIIFVALTYGHPDDLIYDVFGRIGLCTIILLNMLITWEILAPAEEDKSAFFQGTKRKIIRFSFMIIFFLTLILTLSGYLLTVSELLPRFVDTLVVFSLVLLVYSISVRALVLSETRLRIRRMKEQRARAALESNSEVEGATDIPDPHLSIEDVGQQTQTLLKTSVFSAVVVALFIVWADVLPALNWLDNVTLWSRTIAVGETEILSRVSLQDLLLSLLLTVIFIIANKNLPGLIEILLSRSQLLDPVHSYTVTTLVRYAISVVAVITIFSLLGLRWSELQWMVAALTLGLGFGLQEVVANFVSGLIMLFERPVRVGDTITIGEFSGTVARIRTRATTIIDWDNREIVVPNKNFITERLINWTLSDSTTRCVIPVGVSYDADPEQVMQLLLEIANDHPLTLKDPAPTVYFLNFADSSLSFELRVYVCQMMDRNITISDLHVRILKAFRQAKIEIAFPQMDLHIRDLPEGRQLQIHEAIR